VVVGRYYERLLRQLGFRARVRIAPQNTDLLAYTADSRNRVQLGTTGWFADRLVTSNFFRPLLTCGGFIPKSTANT
jgi:hypothetical protein